MERQNVIIVGLTGGIASGKSTVSQILAGLGATVIDADKLGHEAYLPGTRGHHDLVGAFGEGILAEDGTVDRRKLGPIVFGAPEKLKQLNQIIWPRIREIAQKRFDERRAAGDRIVVLEAAVLFEAGWDADCDEVWTTEVDQEQAIARLVARNNLTPEAALARITAQLTNEERRKRAKVVIVNTGSLEDLEAQVRRHWQELQERIGAFT
jgi:phosphopantetheine adenylyltransferase/dephospho-CoA kinase